MPKVPKMTKIKASCHFNYLSISNFQRSCGTGMT
jgi:hypothetical protein